MRTDIKNIIKDYTDHTYDIHIMRKAKKPEFNKSIKTHDWRNYIPDSIKKRWPHLHLETRICLIYVAELSAENEEWD